MSRANSTHDIKQSHDTDQHAVQVRRSNTWRSVGVASTSYHMHACMCGAAWPWVLGAAQPDEPQERKNGAPDRPQKSLRGTGTGTVY